MGCCTRSCRALCHLHRDRSPTSTAALPRVIGAKGVLHCFSWREVGRAMAAHLHTELPLKAPRMALVRCGPTLPLLHHTDRGCRPRVSRPHNCWDTAVAGGLFATPKSDPICRRLRPPEPRPGAPTSSTSRPSPTSIASTPPSGTLVPWTLTAATPASQPPLNRSARQTRASAPNSRGLAHTRTGRGGAPYLAESAVVASSMINVWGVPWD